MRASFAGLRLKQLPPPGCPRQRLDHGIVETSRRWSGDIRERL